MSEPTTSSPMRTLCNEIIDRIAELDPVEATGMGVSGYDDRLTDFGPDGVQARAALATQAVAEATRIASNEPLSDADRLDAQILAERLGNVVQMAETGDLYGQIDVLTAAPHQIRHAFELMPPDAENASARLIQVPQALAGWQDCLDHALAIGVPVPARQAMAVATQLQVLGQSWYSDHVAQRYPAADLADAAAAADAAVRATGQWLTEFADRASPTDAVGRDRYQTKSAQWLGASIDLDDTYAWGFSELAWITERMRAALDRLDPAVELADAERYLNGRHDTTIDGTDALLGWLNEVVAQVTTELDGRLFDIDDRIRNCEVKLAAEGAAAAPYYVPPSEDLSRPGSTWYPTLGRTQFPKWWLLSVWYHESIPGHHLQFGTVAVERERLSRFQRMRGWTSGYGEGWALYSERLMDEIGAFEDPAYELGFLSGQAMRAARVVVDIGLHVGLPIPARFADRFGTHWKPESAQAFLTESALLDPDFAASEINRYLGLPGQAISYKVGERVWLAEREAAKARLGGDFDLKDWHMWTLRAGHMGLDPFRSHLQTYRR